MSQRRRAKLFRDPIHDVISFDPASTQGKLITRLIDTQPMQRLRHIRQLGMASLVYHGAEHSRFAHSLGVAHLSEKIFDTVHQGGLIDFDERVVVCVAGLLHDVGHGPFSHALESTLQKILGVAGDHEVYTREILLWEEGEIHRILRELDPQLPAQVAAFLSHQSGLSSENIVSSQLDADRMDYLLRDGYMTGVQNYRYDADRILKMLDQDDQGLIVDQRALQAVESYLLSRFHMYQQVYFHKTVRSAATQLKAVFKRVIDLARGGDLEIIPDSPFGALFQAALRGLTPSPREYVRITENHAWCAFDAWADSSDPVLSDLASGFRVRRLLKPISIPAEAEAHFARSVLPEIRNIAKRLGRDPNYYVWIDHAEDAPYKPYNPAKSSGAQAIRVRLRDGSTEPIEAVSEVVKALVEIRFRATRLCVREDLRSAIEPLLLSEGILKERRP